MKVNRLLIGSAVGAVVILVLVLFVLVPRLARTGTAVTPPTAQPAAAADQRKITATLFFIGEDGLSLEPVQREVSFGEPVGEQARYIIEAQIAAPPAPMASAIPVGTKLRAVFVTERGEAFVDLTGEVTAKHTGGALDELFTVYAIVNALTVNLPAITKVQILIDGKEADTLAGHVDLRQPLSKNLTWIKATNRS